MLESSFLVRVARDDRLFAQEQNQQWRYHRLSVMCARSDP